MHRDLTFASDVWEADGAPEVHVRAQAQAEPPTSERQPRTPGAPAVPVSDPPNCMCGAWSGRGDCGVYHSPGAGFSGLQN